MQCCVVEKHTECSSRATQRLPEQRSASVRLTRSAVFVSSGPLSLHRFARSPPFSIPPSPYQSPLYLFSTDRGSLDVLRKWTRCLMHSLVQQPGSLQDALGPYPCFRTISHRKGQDWRTNRYKWDLHHDLASLWTLFMYVMTLWNWGSRVHSTHPPHLRFGF